MYVSFLPDITMESPLTGRPRLTAAPGSKPSVVDTSLFTAQACWVLGPSG